MAEVRATMRQVDFDSAGPDSEAKSDKRS